jgi:hypothetical protein
VSSGVSSDRLEPLQYLLQQKKLAQEGLVEEVLRRLSWLGHEKVARIRRQCGGCWPRGAEEARRGVCGLGWTSAAALGAHQALEVGVHLGRHDRGQAGSGLLDHRRTDPEVPDSQSGPYLPSPAGHRRLMGSHGVHARRSSFHGVESQGLHHLPLHRQQRGQYPAGTSHAALQQVAAPPQ